MSKPAFGGLIVERQRLSGHDRAISHQQLLIYEDLAVRLARMRHPGEQEMVKVAATRVLDRMAIASRAHFGAGEIQHDLTGREVSRRQKRIVDGVKLLSQVDEDARIDESQAVPLPTARERSVGDLHELRRPA